MLMVFKCQLRFVAGVVVFEYQLSCPILIMIGIGDLFYLISYVNILGKKQSRFISKSDAAFDNPDFNCPEVGVRSESMMRLVFEYSLIAFVISDRYSLSNILNALQVVEVSNNPFPDLYFTCPFNILLISLFHVLGGKVPLKHI